MLLPGARLPGLIIGGRDNSSFSRLDDGAVSPPGLIGGAFGSAVALIADISHGDLKGPQPVLAR